MALDLRETQQLVSVLQLDSQPFQVILEKLKSLPRLEGGGRVCLALRCMFYDNYYHTAGNEANSELLITCFILYSFSVQGSKPIHTKGTLFQILQHLEGSIRATTIQKAREKIAIKVFVLQCLAGKTEQEVLSKTPRQVLSEEAADLEIKHAELQIDKHIIASLKEAEQAYLEEKSLAANGQLSKGVTPLVVMPDHNKVDNGNTEEWNYYTSEALGLRFDPLCDRPLPPPLGISDQELSWLCTEGYTTDIIWDSTISNSPDEALELRDRVQKALRQNLALEEQQNLKQKLSQNDDVLLRVGVSPLQFPTLVERNSVVATHFITTLVSTNVSTADEFLTSLVHMNPCLGACHVMSVLVKMPTFPPHYAEDFITNSITFIKSQRKATDTRRISIICHFCLSLARETDTASPRYKVLQSKDVVQQLTQFALDNSAVSEAQSLYKTLKERGDTGGET
eukprot:TRINITY_DN1848_c2_g1_i2.p1 TRINITY_DN1848_c2_g1~~TRINITY_DN1848_c2_g1_i2.p1  ORF type:complete len:453 (+),score=80.45 TRINITY_DN1848_c2_g1_i2:133-1491(+)